MKRRRAVHLGSIVCIGLLVVGTVLMADDEWENADDTSANTRTLLWHTMPPQRHDLQNQGGTADQDWFLVFPRVERSYEVQVLNVAGDALSTSTTVQRVAGNGVSVLQNATALSPRTTTGTEAGFNYTIRWHQQVASDAQFIRVMGGNAYGASSQYDIQLFDTTLQCPRWNNAGSQITVLILQGAQTDTAGLTCSYTVYWYGIGQNRLATTTGFLGPNDVDVINTGSIIGLPGFSGAAHIAHTCGMGGVHAKAVALEPTTGFSFDTPCTYLPK